MFNYKGTTVEVNSSGRFTAVMDDGVRVEADTLDAAKAKIDRELSARKAKKLVLSLKVVGLKSTSPTGRRYGRKEPCGPVGVVLTGVNRNDRSMQFDGIGKNDTLDDVIPDAGDNFNLLKRKFELVKELNEVEERIVDLSLEVGEYGVINIEDYPGVLKKLGERYKQAMARSNKKAKAAK